MKRLLVVTTNDGMVFTGYSPAQIVRQMKNTEWSAPPAKGEYISEVVKRVSSMTGVRPHAPIENPERSLKLLQYLRHVGLVRVRLVDEIEDEE